MLCPDCARPWPATLRRSYRRLLQECVQCAATKLRRLEFVQERLMVEGESVARLDLAWWRSLTSEQREQKAREDKTLW